MGLAASCSRSSQDLRGLANRGAPGPSHSRAASLDLRHARNSSADLNKLFRNDVGLIFNTGGKLLQSYLSCCYKIYLYSIKLGRSIMCTNH